MSILSTIGSAARSVKNRVGGNMPSRVRGLTTAAALTGRALQRSQQGKTGMASKMLGRAKDLATGRAKPPSQMQMTKKNRIESKLMGFKEFLDENKKN